MRGEDCFASLAMTHDILGLKYSARNGAAALEPSKFQA
jgi:hypothetical protein